MDLLRQKKGDLNIKLKNRESDLEALKLQVQCLEVMTTNEHRNLKLML